MRTEEILRREAEYREVREALGTYLVDVVVGDLSAGPPSPAVDPRCPEGSAGRPVTAEGRQPQLDG
jgi:hypothetical protein